MIDQAYLVSVQDLREICQELSTPTTTYRIKVANNKKNVSIFFNDDPEDFYNSALSFTFPIVVNVPGLILLHKNEEAGAMVCLSIYTARQTQHTLYGDEGKSMKEDGEQDWMRFWVPLQGLLSHETSEMTHDLVATKAVEDLQVVAAH